MRQKKWTILRLCTYLVKYKGLLILALIFTVGSNLFALIGPRLTGYAINAIEPGVGKVDFKTVFMYAGWMAGFYLVSVIMSYGLQVLMLTISRKVVYRMREDVFKRLMSLPVGYFDTHQTGDIISRLSYDIDTINGSLTNDVVTLLATVITVVGALVMMILISPELVLVFAVTVPLSMVLTKIITGKTRPLFRKRSAALGNMNGFVEEMLTGQKTLKAYAREDYTIERFDEKNKEAVDAYYNAEYYGSIVGPVVNFVNNLSMSLIGMLGAVLYLMGRISIGNISSFVLYSRKFSGPINEVANIMNELQSALAAAERVFKLLDEMPEPADADHAIELDAKGNNSNTGIGDVSFNHIAFGYEKDKKIIHDLSFKVKKGQMVAIVGPTGAGKTTLINLLMRFYDADDGSICLGDVNTRDITRKSLRKSYAMVLQDTWLFTGTIYENIVYGKEGATMEDAIRVAKAAHIHSYIEKLPQGYDTVLQEEGTNISKGQKQLLTIARAMLLDAGMLILDEATSNVDTRTEQKIQKAMRSLMQDKTCFVIAHRLSTIRNADLILVVNDGKIVEQGTHESLMKQDGMYSKLYKAQLD